MRSWMYFLTMVLLLSPNHARGGEADPPVELHVRCLNGDPCRFTGETIFVELEVVNTGNEGVALPLEYFRKQGPKIILVDKYSNEKRHLSMGPPKVRLFDQMEVLAPGQSIRIPWSIPDHHISRFALRPVNITAIFRFYLEPGTERSVESSVSAYVPIEEGG
jgi:hypothetical protein